MSLSRPHYSWVGMPLFLSVLKKKNLIKDSKKGRAWRGGAGCEEVCQKGTGSDYLGGKVGGKVVWWGWSLGVGRTDTGRVWCGGFGTWC